MTANIMKQCTKTNMTNPSIIARETLKQLLLLKVSPTPDNYHKIYDQIAGNPRSQLSEPILKVLSEIAREFPRHTSELLDIANKLEEAINQKNIAKYKATLIKLITDQYIPAANSSVTPKKSDTESIIPWAETIKNLFLNFEAENNASTKKKRWKDLYHILERFTQNSEQLHFNLEGLINSWNSTNSSIQITPDQSATPLSIQSDNTPSHQQSLLGNCELDSSTHDYFSELQELLVQLLKHIAIAVSHDETLSVKAALLTEKSCQAHDSSSIKNFIRDLQELCHILESHEKADTELHQGLLNLLNLLIDSTGELLAEDQWIQEQILRIKESISKPLSMRIVIESEQLIKNIIQRKQLIKRNISQTKETVKSMVNSLLNNIEELSNATGLYQDKLADFSGKVNQTSDLEELNQLLLEIMHETRLVQSSVLSHRKDLLAARTEINKAQAQINQLEVKLQEMGEKVHEDYLTGIYNRRGLDNAFEREMARAQRNQQPLCFVLLDIDNFKQLNDTHGHQVGDDAIVFLVNAIKEATRAEDIVSRYGGEEFAILLPNTTLETGFSITSRILRNLTKKFFLFENKRLLITFSAGITQYQVGETQESIFKRADEAMYKAKRSGKNQIVAA
mgnify:CR=1 FL=1